jgi:hypothetical protein
MSLLTELDTFFSEHRACGDVDAGVEGPFVWIACECGAGMAVKWPKPTSMTGQVRLQATSGRRRRTSCRSTCSGQGFVSIASTRASRWGCSSRPLHVMTGM